MNKNPTINRRALRERIVSTLDTGSLVLHGSRRIGKSTLLQQLVSSPPHAMHVVRIDLEGLLASPIDQLADGLHQALVAAGLADRSSVLARVRKVAIAGNEVEVDAITASTGWERLRQDLIAALERCGDHRLVVALDEVPWWLDALTERSGASEARAALATLRRIRQEPQFADRLRVILTGSIGLAGLAAALDASAELNDLASLDVPPMTDEEGAALFEAELTARGARCGGLPARYAARLAGGSPHWIKVLAAAIGSEEATTARVDAAVESLLSPAQRRLFADEGQEHFRRRHPDLYPALVAILDAVAHQDTEHPLEAAVTAALAARADLTRRRAEECVWLLVDGFYLRAEGERLAWVNPMFRRWWQRYGGA
jgi:hypothetical protein